MFSSTNSTCGTISDQLIPQQCPIGNAVGPNPNNAGRCVFGMCVTAIVRIRQISDPLPKLWI
jgi:hypothetical protein